MTTVTEPATDGPETRSEGSPASGAPEVVDTWDLLLHVDRLARRILALTAEARGEEAKPLDPLRGLYVRVGDLPGLGGLARDTRARTGGAARTGPPPARRGHRPLAALAARCELDPLDLRLLVVAAAPDVDRRFERYYGFLHDDVSRRRASVGLALHLAGASAAAGVDRRRLSPQGPLVRHGLVAVDEPDRPVLSRPLRVAERVTAYLLGDDEPPAAVTELAPEDPLWVQGDPAQVVRALSERSPLGYLREPAGAGTAVGLGVEAFRRVGLDPLVVDLERLPPEGAEEVLAAAVLEARLAGRGLVAGPLDACLPGREPLVRLLGRAGWPTLLTGTGHWDAGWSRRVPFHIEVAPATVGDRGRIWAAVLDGDLPPDLDPQAVTASFRLGPSQVARAATSAWIQAGVEARPLAAEDLRSGARGQNGGRLEHLAHRIEPRSGWDDLILPATPRGLLEDLCTRARWRELVLDTWGMRQTGRRGDGISALFGGQPGTGKTTAAEVLAGALGFDLYTVDLATVVDKYIGETEKNLERIFDAAERVNGVLFFDEADALFGKRSDVKDARDRYANVEVAYLLQRMEAFDGVAILATNLSANLDEAFTRRLDAVIEFPMPDAGHRRALWERCLGSELARADDIDLAFCSSFELSGGDIRNIVLSAAFRVAEERRSEVTMLDLVVATGREYRKLGRLCTQAEFGSWFEPLLAAGRTEVP